MCHYKTICAYCKGFQIAGAEFIRIGFIIIPELNKTFVFYWALTRRIFPDESAYLIAFNICKGAGLPFFEILLTGISA